MDSLSRAFGAFNASAGYCQTNQNLVRSDRRPVEISIPTRSHSENIGRSFAEQVIAKTVNLLP
jgi:hypothetical protein